MKIFCYGLLLFTFALFLPGIEMAYSQPPNSITIQGRLSPASPIMGATARILRDGTTVQTLLVDLLPGANGVFVTALVGVDPAVFAVPGTYFVSLSSPTGEGLATMPLRSVPFAFRSDTADTLIPGATIQVSSLLTSSATVSGDLVVGGSATAAAFFGSGSGLTGLNAANLSSGILPDGRLADTYGGLVNFLNAGSTFTASLFTGGRFVGDGSGLSNLPGGGGAPSSTGDLVLQGDSDADGTGDVILKTGSNDRLHVLNNGRVGIGPSSPLSQLHLLTSGSSSLGSGFRLGPSGFDWEMVPNSTFSDMRFIHVPTGLSPLILRSNEIVVGATASFAGRITFGLGALNFNTSSSCGGFLGNRTGAYNFVIDGSNVATIFKRTGSIAPGCAPLSATLAVNGNFTVTGSKGFLVDHPNDPTKTITYYSVEGPEAATFVRGTAQLINGQATVSLPDHFALVTSTAGAITVQVTPQGDCKGLFVAEKGRTQIVVKELSGGTSSVIFDYLVQGVRAGFENAPVIQTKPPPEE